MSQFCCYCKNIINEHSLFKAKCDHIYHIKCLNKIYHNSKYLQCCECKKEIIPNDGIYTHTLNNTMENEDKIENILPKNENVLHKNKNTTKSFFRKRSTEPIYKQYKYLTRISPIISQTTSRETSLEKTTSMDTDINNSKSISISPPLNITNTLSQESQYTQLAQSQSSQIVLNIDESLQYILEEIKTLLKETKKIQTRLQTLQQIVEHKQLARDLE